MKKIILPSVLTLTLLCPTGALGANTYTVNNGDTLAKIATEHNISLSELLKANPEVDDPNQITIGQAISLPTTKNVAAQASSKSIEQQVLDLVNAERAQAGLKELKMDEELSNVAKAKSEDMRDNNYFSHTSPTYGSPFDMMKSFGINYTYAGENIAAGQTSPSAVMKSWMNSAGHKANILNKNYTHIGIGYVKGGTYSRYWTQQFIGK
ncbi:CAP domain-containing protein [Peribacillus sp. NPDC097295]|uniref:CAP domain-containing protein n=1 Tax=Peribacillus sp. NPDC097295 TaxID=3364402 RepID=UPI00381C1D8F